MNVPKSGMRPTQDKVRSAIFSSLAANVPGARVLDLFAGSGAFGVEALSRDAQWVDWVESDPRHFAVLRDNIHRLKIDDSRGRAVCADVFRFLELPSRRGAYDLVFSDPPYELARQENWAERLAALLVEKQWVGPGGIWVHESNAAGAAPEWSGWALAKDKQYGETRVWILVRKDGG